MVSQAIPETVPIWRTSSDRLRVQRTWLGLRRQLRGVQAVIFQEYGREDSLLCEVAWVIGVICRGIEERYGLAPRRKSLE